MQLLTGNETRTNGTSLSEKREVLCHSAIPAKSLPSVRSRAGIHLFLALTDTDPRLREGDGA